MRAVESALIEETGDQARSQTIMEEDVLPRVESPALTVERLFTEKRRALARALEQTVPGFALMFTFWLSVFVAASIQSEKKEYHTWARTLVSPVPRLTVLPSRIAAFVVVGLVQMTLLFALAAVVFGLHLGDHPYALLFVFAAMGLVTTGFGILMTALVKDFVTLNSIMNVLVVLVAAGGALVSAFLLPDWLRAIAPLTPHYWAMDASQGILLLGEGLPEVAPEIGALLAFAWVFFVLGLWRFQFVD